MRVKVFVKHWLKYVLMLWRSRKVKLENKIEYLKDYDGFVLKGSRVLTNGTFGIIHYGHLKYLERARSLGDELIVGMNSNESIKHLKGYDPFMSTMERAETLASMYFVDKVIIYRNKTAKRLIETVRPDVYVKGGDYTVDSINQKERKLLERLGSKIKFVSVVVGYSSSNYLRKIYKSYENMLNGGKEDEC